MATGRWERVLPLRLVVEQFAAATDEDRRLMSQHAPYYWLVLAESHLTRRLFAAIPGKIAVLPSPAG